MSAPYESLDTTLTSPEKKLLIGNWVSFVIVVAFNALGSTGNLSGKNIGDISRVYQTSFTPGSSAFSIWGLIYFGVASWLVMQTIPSTRMMRSAESRRTLTEDVGYWFMGSCACNFIWILLFVWETPVTTWLSVPFLFGLLITLTMMAERAGFWIKPRNSIVERIVFDGTFSVYCGWATVASIVNVAAALVSSGWQGEPWTASGWSVLMMCIAAVVNLLILVRRKNAVWALVYTWAVYWISQANSLDKPVYVTALILSSLVGIAALVMAVFQLWQAYSSSKDQEESQAEVPAGQL